MYLRDAPGVLGCLPTALRWPVPRPPRCKPDADVSEVLVHTNIAVWWRVRGKNRLDGLERRALQGQAALLARLIDTLAQHAAQ